METKNKLERIEHLSRSIERYSEMILTASQEIKDLTDNLTSDAPDPTTEEDNNPSLPESEHNNSGLSVSNESQNTG